MTSVAYERINSRSEPGRSGRPIAAIAIAFVVLGLIQATSPLAALSYLLVLGASVLPIVLWSRRGESEIPAFPLAALAHIVYFALPIIGKDERFSQYTDWEVLRASATVAAYLLIGTAAWQLASGKKPRDEAFDLGGSDVRNIRRLIFTGLFMGIGFHLGAMADLLGFLGTLFGVFRSMMVSLCVIACFFVGILRARGQLSGTLYQVALALIVVLVISAWTSLFLVAGVLYMLAVIIGYVLMRGRVPWLILAILAALVVVLHSGKGEMRSKYWIGDANYGSAGSIWNVPQFALEWVTAGSQAIAAGEMTNALERTSLMQMLLMTQTQAPDFVTFLDGETYAMLPQILVPRFISADKPASQVGMDLLNIHYGLLTYESASVTAIGWGMLAEGYANFGYSGVVLIALFVGGVCGLFSRWSAGKTVVSIPFLINIVAMMMFINLEADFIQLVTALMQAFGAVLLFFAGYGWMVIRSERAVPQRS